MQPNSRLLINYGIVDENNPYDKLPLSGETGGGHSGVVGHVCLGLHPCRVGRPQRGNRYSRALPPVSALFILQQPSRTPAPSQAACCTAHAAEPSRCTAVLQ